MFEKWSHVELGFLGGATVETGDLCQRELLVGGKEG